MVSQFCVNLQINWPYKGGEDSDVASLKTNWLNKRTGYNDTALKTDLHFLQQRFHNKTLSSRRVATYKYCRARIWRPWSKKCQQSLYFWFSTTYFAVNILKNFFIEEPRNSRHLDSVPSKYWVEFSIRQLKSDSILDSTGVGWVKPSKKGLLTCPSPW